MELVPLIWLLSFHRALGHGANRGKVYYLHPELFKVSVLSELGTHSLHLSVCSMHVTEMTKPGSMKTSFCLYTEGRYIYGSTVPCRVM